VKNSLSSRARNARQGRYENSWGRLQGLLVMEEEKLIYREAGEKETG
jgi:hypothetical protein